MAKVHGKSTYVSVDGDDISEFSNNVDFKRAADSHDVTTFGANSKAYNGGLMDGTVSISGIYDNAVGGPRATLEPLLGTTIAVVYRPEGTGASKPQKTVDALLTSYSETAPVADMVSWTAEFQMSGDVTNTTQV